MADTKTRDQVSFELAMTREGYPGEMFKGFDADGEWTYYDKSANIAFDAWKLHAARAAVPAQVPAPGEWRGSLAQVVCDVPLPDRNDKYQAGFVDAKQAVLRALRKAGFDRAAIAPDLSKLQLYTVNTEYEWRDIRPVSWGEYIKLADAQALLAAAVPGGGEPSGRELYTCIGKGGEYELIGHAMGAGKSKLINDLTVYRDTKTGVLYFRELSDFQARMAPVAASAPQGQQEPGR